MGWKNCARHACSEIRANYLSGDCHYKRELLQGHTRLLRNLKECVTRRALKSLQNNLYFSEAQGCHCSCLGCCYENTSPFDRAP
ncbi:hypothetical protein KSP39_PZI017470 [Platanthera zijinensis]|uniref:Mitochondrial inner membrane protease ATP23 n=1 Tax=Platanthera zijinensis TaxID=2320716 RepID=A0AAP0G016_9ASPA